VIRGMTNWGQFDLPSPKTRHQTRHTQGHYFVMQFDSGVKTQESIRKFLALDPRMLRYSVIKIGDRLGTGPNYGGVEAVDGKESLSWRQGDKEGVFHDRRVFGGELDDGSGNTYG
jgi:small subunit ribosomal protein S6